MRGRTLIPWMILLAAGCARVGGESTPFPGIDFPPTPDETVLAIHRAGLPTCPFEEIGTVEAYAELEVSPSKLEEAGENHRAEYIEEAERKAMAELRDRVRAMGGHGVIDVEESLPGTWERYQGEIGDRLFDDDAPDPQGSISYSWGESRPRYKLHGTVIRFTDPACREGGVLE